MLHTPPEGTDWCHLASLPLPHSLAASTVRYGHIEGDVGSAGGSDKDARARGE